MGALWSNGLLVGGSLAAKGDVGCKEGEPEAERPATQEVTGGNCGASGERRGSSRGDHW